jgi:hypothetical protein
MENNNFNGETLSWIGLIFIFGNAYLTGYVVRLSSFQSNIPTQTTSRRSKQGCFPAFLKIFYSIFL